MGTHEKTPTVWQCFWKHIHILISDTVNLTVAWRVQLAKLDTCATHLWRFNLCRGVIVRVKTEGLHARFSLANSCSQAASNELCRTVLSPPLSGEITLQNSSLTITRLFTNMCSQLHQHLGVSWRFKVQHRFNFCLLFPSPTYAIQLAGSLEKEVFNQARR